MHHVRHDLLIRGLLTTGPTDAAEEPAVDETVALAIGATGVTGVCSAITAAASSTTLEAKGILLRSGTLVETVARTLSSATFLPAFITSTCFRLCISIISSRDLPGFSASISSKVLLP